MTDTYIENLITAGVLTPAARTMHPQDALTQYNEANALGVDDEGFLIHPDLTETTITTGDGRERRGWALRSNPQATTDTPNLKLLQGTDRISRHLGAQLLGGLR